MKKDMETKPRSDILDLPGQWFVINSNTGHEDRVLADLQQKIKTSNLENDIFDIRISKARVTTKSGKEVIKNRFPGYIFINMNMNESAWFVVRNTPGVTGFIGSSGKGAKPFPLTTAEVDKMISILDETGSEPPVILVSGEPKILDLNPKARKVKGVAVPKKELFKADFVVNDFVRIKDGPYQNEEGKVTDIDYSKGVAIVSLEIFGRYTPAEVSFSNLEPIKNF